MTGENWILFPNSAPAKGEGFSPCEREQFLSFHNTPSQKDIDDTIRVAGHGDIAQPVAVEVSSSQHQRSPAGDVVAHREVKTAVRIPRDQ